jgi:DNA sulfur modification protein DndD
MKLEFIQLNNFRQFYGKQLADFSTANDLNVSVFHGVNGAGKTSLFSAINWCLYENAIGDIGDLINRQKLAEIDEGDEISASVSVAFLHQGHRFIANREIRGKKDGKKVIRLKQEASLDEVKESGDIEPIPNMIGTMNAILPNNVRPYFFFDGEKMDDLTKADSTEVEQAIQNFIRLPALERAEKHLQAIASEFRRKIKRKGTAELEDFIIREEDLREEKSKLQEKLEVVRKEIGLARDQIIGLENRLRECEDVGHLQEMRDRIREHIETLQEEELNTIRLIQDSANRGFTIFLMPVVQNALSALDEKRERGEIPSGIREQFLKDLLQVKECICGRSFEDGDEVFDRLERLLKRSLPAGIESQALSLGGDLLRLSKNAEDWVKSIEDNTRKREDILARIETLRREDDDVDRQLKGVPIEEIAGLEKKRNQFQHNYELYLQDEGRITQRLEDINRDIESVRNKVKKAEAKQAKLRLLATKEDFAQRSADAVECIKEEFIEDTRRNVETSTKEVFIYLAWKQDHFQDITIGSDFRMEVIDRWGTPTRRELSAGERQVLSLSFICAMAKVAGEEAPLVMDTPFGRLSRDHLEAVAKNLPDLTSQLVLFVTDREWDQASSTQLEPRIGAQYELQFKEGCTTITEIDWQ